MVQKTTDAFHGNYAVKIGTIQGIEYYPGKIFTGFAVSLNPTKLEVFVKAEVRVGDTVYINVRVFESNIHIGGGDWEFADSITSYTKINIPISITMGKNADSVSIELISGCCPRLGADPKTVLIADSFLLNFSTGIDEKKSWNLQIFPNPTDNFLFIKMPLDALGKELIFINLLGEVRYSVLLRNQEMQICTDELGNGLFFAVLVDEKKTIIYTDTFIVF